MGCGSAGGPMTSPKMVANTKELEMVKKRRKFKIVDASHVKSDIIKHCRFLCTKGENTQLYPKMA